MTLSRLVKPYYLFFFLFSLLSNVGVAQYEVPDKLPKLGPNNAQKIASINIVQLLQRNHYGDLPLNNTTSEKLFDSYLKALDPNRQGYFTQSDVKKFQTYRHRFDTALKTGDLEPAFAIYQQYQIHAKQRLDYILKRLDEGIGKLDFNKNESILIDRSKAPWPKNQTELKNLWRKSLKDNILRLRINGKKDNEIAKTLTKRYKSQMRRLYQVQSEDVFQAYMNAFTQIYDPHTQYFSPRRAKNFDINMSLSLEGIGAVLQAEDEYVKVVRLIPGGPAAKAGQLKPSDQIVGVCQGKSKKKGNLNCTDVIGWRLDDVVDLIRGPKGSSVTLEVLGAGNTSGVTNRYKIIRDKVKLEEQSAHKSLLTYKRNERIYKVGVITVPTFYLDFRAAREGLPNYKSTTRDVGRLIKELRKENIDGLVIDLRNNGGGSLQEASQMIGLFIPPGGPTVQVRNHIGQVNIQENPEKNLAYSGPMTVLVNRLSASASEIFTGALQDYGRALVVGGQTFGKGTVQTLQPLNHGQLKLTIAKFYRVTGDSTQNRGIHPDISYPDLYNNNEIGESALPNAMPWDKIPTARYYQVGDLSKYISPLTSRHRTRAKNDPYFSYVKQKIQFFDKHEQQKRISLNATERKKTQKKIEKEQLNMENQLRKATGKKTLKSIKDFEKEQEQKFASPNQKEDPSEDALLVETGEILLDYAQMKYKTFKNRTPPVSTIRH